MKQNSLDEFDALDLPFKTYINTCIEHEDEMHEEMEFVWVIEGKVKIFCEKKIYELGSDEVFMIYMNQIHSVKSEPDSLMFSFRLKKSYLLQHHLSFHKIPFLNRIYSFEELAQKYHAVPLIISQIVLLLKTTNPSPSTRYKIIGYYNMYIYDLYSVRMKERYLDIKKKNCDEYLIRFHTVIEYINQNYHQTITLTTLAKMLKLSTFRLSHFIRNCLGISFQEYLQIIRFEQALHALKNTHLPISVIVRNCGFSDPKYLNAIMKKKFQITALQYRSIMKKSIDYERLEFNHPKLLNELSIRLHHIDQGLYMRDTFGLKENVF